MLFKIINRGVEHVFKILSEIISEIKFEFFNMGVKGRNFFPRSDFCSLYLRNLYNINFKTMAPWGYLYGKTWF